MPSLCRHPPCRFNSCKHSIHIVLERTAAAATRQPPAAARQPPAASRQPPQISHSQAVDLNDFKQTATRTNTAHRAEGLAQPLPFDGTAEGHAQRPARARTEGTQCLDSDTTEDEAQEQAAGSASQPGRQIPEQFPAAKRHCPSPTQGCASPAGPDDLEEALLAVRNLPISEHMFSPWDSVERGQQTDAIYAAAGRSAFSRIQVSPSHHWSVSSCQIAHKPLVVGVVSTWGADVKAGISSQSALGVQM